jgi:hypothetical protein
VVVIVTAGKVDVDVVDAVPGGANTDDHDTPKYWVCGKRPIDAGAETPTKTVPIDFESKNVTCTVAD